MGSQEIQGDHSVFWIGVSNALSEDEPATLEDAIHDAALQAAHATPSYAGKPVRVVEIEFEAHNPHITQYKVKAIPGS